MPGYRASRRTSLCEGLHQHPTASLQNVAAKSKQRTDVDAPNPKLPKFKLTCRLIAMVLVRKPGDA